MIKKKESCCVVCGRSIEQPEQGRSRKYCGKKCSAAYHNRKSAAKTKLPGGLAKCAQCGKEFVRDGGSTRKRCSLKCEQARGRRIEAAEIQRLLIEDESRNRPRTLREQALEMHYNGYGRMAIKEAFGLRGRTLKTWLEKYSRDADGNWKRESKTRYSYNKSKTVDEWLLSLRENMRTEQNSCDCAFGKRAIVIVCGAVSMRKGVDGFRDIIHYKLQKNPFDGSVYVFCGFGRNKIVCVYWDGEGFSAVSRRCEYGTYPWPSQQLGMVVTVTNKDFNFILHGCGKNPEKP